MPFRHVLDRKRPKFNNKPQVVDGIRFDSIKEANRYAELKALRKCGQVVRFLIHPKFHFEAGLTYTADFLVFWSTGDVTVEDVKGGKATQTEAFRKNQKLMAHHYPELPLEVI